MLFSVVIGLAMAALFTGEETNRQKGFAAAGQAVVMATISGMIFGAIIA